jgi:uncharacterized protein (DUF1697 family)
LFSRRSVEHLIKVFLKFIGHSHWKLTRYLADLDHSGRSLTMPKYVAFLRAINVGGHTVKMDYLRQVFEAVGFSNVETFIASGNVIFESKSKNAKALEKKIEDCLQETLGYRVTTFIRSLPQLAEIANYKPFNAAQLEESHAVYIAFLADVPSDEAKQKLLSFTTATDEFHFSGRELYWLARKNFSESTFSGALLEKALGMPATLRNTTTVKKIATKYP